MSGILTKDKRHEYRLNRWKIRRNAVSISASFHPGAQDGNYWLLIRKGGVISSDKEFKKLRGGIHRYAAQINLNIDAAKAAKNPFRTETSLAQSA
jgi:hypothetical protein